MSAFKNPFGKVVSGPSESVEASLGEGFLIGNIKTFTTTSVGLHVTGEENLNLLSAPKISLTNLLSDFQHKLTNWMVLKLPEKLIVWGYGGIEHDLTEINMPDGVLETNADYEFRFQAKQEGYGWINWIKKQLPTPSEFPKYERFGSLLDFVTKPAGVFLLEEETSKVWATGLDYFNLDPDNHSESEWRVTRTSDSTVIEESLNDTTNLVEYDLDESLYTKGEEYKFEFRGYDGSWSDWFEKIKTWPLYAGSIESFTTAS